MITTKRDEIRFKSGRLCALLFPYTLLVTESNYNFNHTKKIVASDPDINFEKFKNEMEIENFNGVQLKMLFDIFDVAYERFVLTAWSEFSSLLKRAYNKNFENLPDDLQFLNDENYINLMKEKIEVKRKKAIENYKLLKEIYLNPKENPKAENQLIVEEFEEDTINDLFDEIRNNEYGKLKLHNILKEKTNLEIEPLKYILSDLDLYLFVEKDEFQSNFSTEDIEEKIKTYTEKGLSIPYYKQTTVENLTEKQIENRKKLNINSEPSIDMEALMFPFEFYSLYEFKNIVLNEIKKHNKVEENNTVTSTNPKLKTNLSVPELALLFKLLKDLKPNIFDVKSEAELHRFISTNFETKKTGDKDISTQKLRNLFNQPDAKAAEFWETNIRLLQADVKKLK